MKKYIILGLATILATKASLLAGGKHACTPTVPGYRLVNQVQTSVGYGSTPGQAVANKGYYSGSYNHRVYPTQIGNSTLWVAKSMHVAPTYIRTCPIINKRSYGRTSILPRSGIARPSYR